MKTRKITSILATLLATSALLLTTSASAGFLYQVVNYSDSDFAISGTIETDGSIGDFDTPPFGFQSWSITWSDPTNAVADVLFDQTNSAWSVTAGNPANFVSVEQTAISLLAPASGQTTAAAHELALSRTDGGYFLNWSISNPDFTPTFGVLIGDNNNFMFERGSPLITYSGGSQVIATAAVPEPATLALLGLGFAGIRAARPKK
jgi:hypothetical protein